MLHGDKDSDHTVVDNFHTSQVVDNFHIGQEVDNDDSTDHYNNEGVDVYQISLDGHGHMVQGIYAILDNRAQGILVVLDGLLIVLDGQDDQFVPDFIFDLKHLGSGLYSY